MKRVIIIIGHIIFWSLSAYIISKIFGISTVEVFAETTGAEEEVVITYDNNFIWATSVTVFLSAMLFYLNVFWLLPAYIKLKNAKSYIIRFATAFILVIMAIVIFNRFINYDETIEDGLFAFPSLEIHLTLVIFFIAISFAYTFIQEWYKNEQQKNKIAQEKLKTELDFLKSQVNPHFLFNTLNNLFSIAQKHNVSELTTGISELSNLMRYMLYDSNTENVSLLKEVNHIESFIEVQRLRFDEDDEVIVNFEKRGNMESLSIAPLIMLPFVENAFKHGFSINENSIINILLDVSDGNIHFEVKNKLFDEPKLSDSASGIGLENVKRRLELIYPNRFDLKITRLDNHYKVVLNIEVNV